MRIVLGLDFLDGDTLVTVEKPFNREDTEGHRVGH